MGSVPTSPESVSSNGARVAARSIASASADRRSLALLADALQTARELGDSRPPLVVIAACIEELGIGTGRPTVTAVPTISLRRGRDEWLARLRSGNRSHSTQVAYRVAIDDLLAFLEREKRAKEDLNESTIVAYLDDYRSSTKPAPATYYRRFILLRRFFRWFSRRANFPDPFLDLEAPRKPQQEADWLTPDEFGRMLDVAAAPLRRLPGLAERDRLVLIALVATALRRSELLALNWGDLDLDSDRPSLLVRRGKGEKPRRVPLAPSLAQELRRLRDLGQRGASDPVFCGLAGKRLHVHTLSAIIGRAAERARIEKRVSAHTLRHTAATWLRQRTGDARLTAAYLGHVDMSTVSRYTHVADDDLHAAAAAISAKGRLDKAFGR